MRQLKPPQRQWAKEASSIEKRKTQIERELGLGGQGGFYNTRSDMAAEAAELQAEMKHLDDGFYRETQRVSQQLKRLHHKMCLVRARLAAYDSGAPLAEDMQSLLEGIEAALVDFKGGMRHDFDTLVSQHDLLSGEIKATDKRLEAWRTGAAQEAWTAKPKRRQGPAAGSQQPGQAEQDQGLEAVTEGINSIVLAEGGPTGGWPQHQHDTFLRHWTQVNGGKSGLTDGEPAGHRTAKLRSLVDRAATALPERNSAEVEEHFQWYIRYLGHLAEKKRVVQQWRLQRDQMRLEEVEEQRKGSQTQKEQQQRENQRQKLREKSRAKEKEALAAWREKKRQAAIEKEAEERSKREAAKQRQQLERQAQRHRQEELAVYRMEMEAEQQQRAQVQKMLQPEKTVRSHIDIEARAREGMDAARKRREEIAARERQKESRAAGRSAATNKKPSWASTACDPQRLLRPTQASKAASISPEDLDDMDEERARAGAHDRTVANSARDLRYSHRATPSWRKGLSKG
ncbi:unnamed protein product [Chrysoparadoxa australica]